MYSHYSDSYHDSKAEVEGLVLVGHSDRHPDAPRWGYTFSSMVHNLNPSRLVKSTSLSFLRPHCMLIIPMVLSLAQIISRALTVTNLTSLCCAGTSPWCLPGNL